MQNKIEILRDTLIKMEFESVFEQASEAIQLNEQPLVEYYALRAQASLCLKRSDKAILDAKQALDIDYKSPTAHLVYAQVMFASQDNEAALAHAHIALELADTTDPKSPLTVAECYGLRFKALHRMGADRNYLVGSFNTALSAHIHSFFNHSRDRLPISTQSSDNNLLNSRLPSNSEGIGQEPQNNLAPNSASVEKHVHTHQELDTKEDADKLKAKSKRKEPMSQPVESSPKRSVVPAAFSFVAKSHTNAEQNSTEASLTDTAANQKSTPGL